MLHIVFARPQQLHRSAHFFRDVGRFRCVVVGQPTAEAAAAADHVQRDRALVDAAGRGSQAARARGNLAARPDLELAVLERRRAVLRFQRSVRNERIRVVRFHHLRSGLDRRLGIAVLARGAHRLACADRLGLRGVRGAAVIRSRPRTFVPGDLQLLARRIRLIPRLRHDRDSAFETRIARQHRGRDIRPVDHERSLDTRQRLDHVQIVRLHLAAEHAALLEHGVQHSRNHLIDA